MGAYIAIEGGDGSGKSTVGAAVAERLKALGHETVMVREPGSTALGEEIRKLLLDGQQMTPWAEAFLFAAQRAQLATEVIAPALSAGKWVISDRTYFSSVAYQGAGRGLGTETVRSINETGLEGVEPDHVFVLDIDVDVALGRQGRPDRIGGEDASFHRSVRGAYQQLAETEPERVKIIDNTMDLDIVVAEIMGHLA
ncbi:MAG: dTMP kinase [Acidimicrobiia bacterium]